MPAAPARDPEPQPPWLTSPGARVLALLDAAGRFERRILTRWIDAHAQAGDRFERVSIPPSRKPGRRARALDPRLEAGISQSDDPLLVPLRVAWLAPRRGSERKVSLRDLLSLGDPRDPGVLRQVWVARRHPDRCRVVVAEPARLSELRARWRSSAGPEVTRGLAEFVARQAALALERAERRLRGSRYKVPRFVREEIVARPGFRGGVARLASGSGRSESSVLRECLRDLREIAATHSTFVIDLVAHVIHLLYTRGYSELLRFDRSQLEQIHALTQRHSAVFLPSHKSNLDHLVLKYALHETGLPPNHTAGGINMNFFPIGPLIRRSGVFFIRRSFRDDPVYQFVLRQYMDYLIEKRFPLEWYIEGGRSRSGKLLPPRFGLLANVVDAYRRGRTDDVFLIPVSIAYDQITDVASYVAEQRGGAKRAESLFWFVEFVRGLRRRYGAIHLRFGEPLSLRTQLGPLDALPGSEAPYLELQKLAFEVSVRINRVTPLTPTSLVTLALLGTGDRALTLSETQRALAYTVEWVRRRKLPTTEELELDRPEGVERALDDLIENGVVTRYEGGPETVYGIGEGQHLAAAYYRNTIIHFFVSGAIAELALLAVAENEGSGEGSEDLFWREAYRLRDLLKFEFFFADHDGFRQELEEELAFQEPLWRERLARGASEAERLVRGFRPFNAHRVLRPFLEAYQVVADLLLLETPGSDLDERAFVARALGLGQQYRLQRRIARGESVSRVLFTTALSLARNRGLLDDEPSVVEKRQHFVRELRDVLRRVDAVDALAASRRAGLID
ncbi:MAG: glycerol-3-phosphate 1-O-acyltransferase [Myxococcota bacterium]